MRMYELRPYQQKLVDESRRSLAKGEKGVLIQSPPGSGKSVVIAEIVRLATLKKGYVLFLAHRRELLTNIEETLQENDVDMNYVIILSVGMAKNRLDQLPKLSLIITDEGHHGRAKTYLDIYEYFKDVPRLGFTATPWRMSGEGFTDIYDCMVEGPDINWLIDNQCLAPFRWFSIPLIDRAKVDFKNMTKEASTSAKLFDATIQGNIVENYKNHADGRQAIVYAPTIEVSMLIAEWFNKENIDAVHVDAKTPTVERDRTMSDFKTGKIKILCNVDLISEGFNVPDVGVIILCRPTQSLVLHLQQSMRGMRYKPGKQSIILDHVGNGSNMGLPTDEYEWSIQVRPKRKKGDPEPPKGTCSSCGQQFLVKSILYIEDKPHCPFCRCKLEFGEKKEVTFDKNVELVELNAEKSRINRLARRSYSKRGSLNSNYKIAQAKVEVSGKGNPLFKMFGSLTIYHENRYEMNELEEFALNNELSFEQVMIAYRWASKKLQEKEEQPEWQKLALL